VHVLHERTGVFLLSPRKSRALSARQSSPTPPAPGTSGFRTLALSCRGGALARHAKAVANRKILSAPISLSAMGRLPTDRRRAGGRHKRRHHSEQLGAGWPVRHASSAKIGVYSRFTAFAVDVSFGSLRRLLRIRLGSASQSGQWIRFRSHIIFQETDRPPLRSKLARRGGTAPRLPTHIALRLPPSR